MHVRTWWSTWKLEAIPHVFSYSGSLFLCLFLSISLSLSLPFYSSYIQAASCSCFLSSISPHFLPWKSIHTMHRCCYWPTSASTSAQKPGDDVVPCQLCRPSWHLPSPSPSYHHPSLLLSFLPFLPRHKMAAVLLPIKFIESSLNPTSTDDVQVRNQCSNPSYQNITMDSGTRQSIRMKPFDSNHTISVD